MREYKWSKGHYLTDGHLWAMLLDIPKLPREDTGERVVLQPPIWPFRDGTWDVPPLECKIYFVPKANIYIAIGEKANGYYDCLFFDKLSYVAECNRRNPNNGVWTDDDDW